MYLQKIVLAGSPSQLPHCLDERPTLDIPHCSTQLDNADIRFFVRIIHRNPRHSLNPVLYRVREVGHHLHSTAKVVTSSLSLDDVQVDLAGGDVIFSSQCYVQVPLVVAQVEVDFSAVVEDENLPMPVDFLVLIVLPLPLLLNGCTYSVGAMVPASTFMYGSTLIEETCCACQPRNLHRMQRYTRFHRQPIFNPMVLSSRPVEEAITPFPMPLITPEKRSERYESAEREGETYRQRRVRTSSCVRRKLWSSKHNI